MLIMYHSLLHSKISLQLIFFSLNLVKLNANRVVVGTLRGFDQFMNLVVDNTLEVNGIDKTDIGMVVSSSISSLSSLQNPLNLLDFF